jgi:MerR family transcriptional regulator, thiopeptide resistance regulator
MDTWSIGELAAQTGLTVRTLHHYDEIGLARPSQRSAAGHRRYTAADVRRLHRIVALRGFGFTLAEIGALLDDAGPDPRELVRGQLDQANDRIARATRLRDRLTTVLGMFDAAGRPSADVLIRLIEEMTTVNAEEFEKMAAQRATLVAKLSPEERAEMAARRQVTWDEMTPEQQAEMISRRPPIPR